MGRAKLWCCGEDDITESFLGTFHMPPLVVTAKPQWVPSVVAACENTLAENVLFNFSYAGSRKRRWLDIFESCIKPALDDGRDVIFHCRAGVHRAALLFVHTLVFGLGMSYSAAQEALTNIRDVKLHQILYSR